MAVDTSGRRAPGGARATAVAIVFGLLAVTLPAAGSHPAGPAARAAAQEASSDAPAVGWIEPALGVEVPPDLGQAPFAVYVASTGHTVRGSMLDYWRATGAGAVYGDPISEPFAAADGYYSQAFERGILQYRPERLFTADPIMGLMPVGDIALADRLGTFRNDGRRGAGGGDRRGEVWRPLNPKGKTAKRAVDDGGVFDKETRHTITGDLLAWYRRHEGRFYLGAPLSEPLAERGMTVQYFEGGALMTGKRGTRVVPLIADLASRLDIDTTPVVQDGSLPLYDETLFWQVPNPSPASDAAGEGVKRIEINLDQQRLRAYDGDTLVLSVLVSTGLDPNGTDEGRFHVRYKVPAQDMEGITDETGEVVAVGAETPEAGAPPVEGERYVVEDVPNVMYFNMEAEALHGAYWHSNFGQKMSHGCVNLPLDVAAFLYGWAPLGTQVWVHD